MGANAPTAPTLTTALLYLGVGYSNCFRLLVNFAESFKLVYRFITFQHFSAILSKFSWCSGYHICLTHRRSPVRSRAKTCVFFSFELFISKNLLSFENLRFQNSTFWYKSLRILISYCVQLTFMDLVKNTPAVPVAGCGLACYC